MATATEKRQMEKVLGTLYSSMEGSDMAMEYDERHGVDALAILTITDDETAAVVSDVLADRVRGKVVIEVGGGIGLLALHLSQHAKQVIVIEANPAWTSCFIGFLYQKKPKNVTWIFGAADEVSQMIRGDVALFCTHSDHEGMHRTAEQFAPEVIDVYREVIDSSPRLIALEKRLIAHVEKQRQMNQL